MKHTNVFLTLLTVAQASCLFLSQPALAQITPDATLGSESSQVRQDTINGLPSDIIDKGARRGKNLFHSFTEFNINQGRGAYFTNPQGVQNILTRVTGVNASKLFGTLGVLGNANLYFLNPNGIIFGPNASLDLNGSFIGTTADSVIFDTGYEFSASKPDTPPLLTVNLSNPIGVTLKENPGDIVVETGKAEIVKENGDTSLDQTQIINDNTTVLPNSISGELAEVNEFDVYQIFLSKGTQITPKTSNNVNNVLFLLDSNGIISNAQNSLPEFTAPQEGTYYLAIRAASPGNYTINLTENTSTLKVQPGKTLALIGGNVTIDGGKIISPGSNIEIGGLKQSGVVSLVDGIKPTYPENVTRSDVNIINGSELNVRSGGGGNLNINAQNFNLNGDSKIRAGIATDLGSPKAQGGDININTQENITIDDTSFIANTVTSITSQGNAGNININAKSLFLNDGSALNTSTFGKGNAGNININTQENVILTGDLTTGAFPGIVPVVQSGAVGKGGNITIDTATLTLENGGLIDASTLGQGNAGAINIKATDGIIVTGENSQGNSSYIASTVVETGVGDSGGITIDTSSLTLKDGGYINMTTYGKGDAGAINIKATGGIIVTGESNQGNGSFIAGGVAKTGVGSSGGITIDTSTLTLENGGSIDASTYGKGDGGAINIKATDGIIVTGESNQGNRSFIASGVAETGVGKGGNITLNANKITLDNISSIESGGLSGSTGDSGSINITTDTIDLKNGSQIDAGNLGSGNANNVTIKANNKANLSGIYNDSKDMASAIITTAATGNAGNIDVIAGSISLSDQAQMNSNTNGKGTGGNINLTATNGDISLANNAQIQASTTGSGNAGNISLQAVTGEISLDNSTAFSNIEAGATGNGGNIDVKAQSLRLENGGQLQTAVKEADTENDLPAGNRIAGNINIDVTDSINLSGQNSDGKNSGIFSILVSGEGQAGDIKIKTKDLDVNNGFISSATQGTGNAGTITLNVDSFNLSNDGRLNSNTAGQGNAGDINITATGYLSIDNSSVFSKVEEKGVSDTPSNINITANNLQLTNGGSIQASTSNQGAAGDINITALHFLGMISM